MKEPVLTPLEQSHYRAANFAANLLLAAATNRHIQFLRAEEQDLSDMGGGAPPLGMVTSLHLQWADIASTAVGES